MPTVSFSIIHVCHTNVCTVLVRHTYVSAAAENHKTLVTLNVDGYATTPGFGEEGFSSTDTNDPLYIGGLPGERLSHVIVTSWQY